MSSLAVLLFLLLSLQSQPTHQKPIWYMCDLCEVSWLSCLLRCPVEQFLNRRHFDQNNVYVRTNSGTGGGGRYKVEQMLENYMKGYTGHDVI